MRPLTATVDLGALAHNYACAKSRARGAQALAVVKANAYGHGVARAARALAGADGFAVVELDAAVRLRQTGHTQRIVLLEGCFEPPEVRVLADYGIATVIHHDEQVAMLDAAPADARLDVLLKVNTGMNRLGFAPAAARNALERLKAHRAVAAITLMTHFADADDMRGVAWQMDVFERALGGETLPRSFANSAAVLRYPETHADVVRPGIMLYGCSPFAESVGADLGLKPAMTLASEIIATREIEPGERVGYGGTYTAESRRRIGIVACGYADGYPRHAPTGTPVRVGDVLTGTVGRVSMDMLAVDLTRVPQAQVGTPVVLWGEGNPVERVATAAGTIGYELLCALAPRVRIVEKP